MLNYSGLLCTHHVLVECHWKLELSERYTLSQCIDVCVSDFTAADPPLSGVRYMHILYIVLTLLV